MKSRTRSQILSRTRLDRLLLSGDVSPAQVAIEDQVATGAESSKDPVIMQKDSPGGDLKAEGDIGQSNPEDKDMYSTRS